MWQVHPGATLPGGGGLPEAGLHPATEDCLHVPRQEGGVRDAQRVRFGNSLPGEGEDLVGGSGLDWRGEWFRLEGEWFKLKRRGDPISS